MIEQSPSPIPSGSSGDLEALRTRANQRQAEYKQVRRSLTAKIENLSGMFRNSTSTTKKIPSRFILHGLIALVLPAAVALSNLQPGVLVRQDVNVAGQVSNSAGFVPPVSMAHNHEIVGDAPLADSSEIPVPISLVSRNEALAPNMVPATVSAERIFIRNGPGTNYDPIGRIGEGTSLQIIGRYGDWFQARESVDQPTFWVSGELINIPPAAVATIWELAEQQIPAPPPPKIGLIRENGTKLRDGPGTNYVAMTPLVPGQVDLIERYNDWLYISAAGNEGWVRADLIDADPLVLERLLSADTVPDVNPALVGTIADNQVNVRKGPDSRYARVDRLDAGLVVDIIGKSKDWVQVRMEDGSKGWVFGDFIEATKYVMRRVPVSNDFPALPQPVRRTGGNTTARTGPAQSANLSAIAASGDAAALATQFVGYPYVWGASGPGAFDCSGLTWYVYRQMGISIPRTASAQFNSRYGAVISSMGSLAPGDLVFFVGTAGPGISHVALYIGGGQIVHAMSPGYGVQISNLYDRYWSSHYYAGLRIYR
jgi:cell wall-associated NlpC family hydrolase